MEEAMSRIDRIVHNARVAPLVEIGPGDSFITTVEGERYCLGREPDAARRAYLVIVEPERMAA
jgi:hypothetical protein